MVGPTTGMAKAAIRGFEGALEKGARRTYGNKYEALAAAFRAASRPNPKPQTAFIADSLTPPGARDVGARTILSLGLPASVSIGALLAGNQTMAGDGGDYLSEDGGADRQRQIMTRLAREMMGAPDPFTDFRAAADKRVAAPGYDYAPFPDAYYAAPDTPTQGRDELAPDLGLTPDERRAQAKALVARWRAERGVRRER